MSDDEPADWCRLGEKRAGYALRFIQEHGSDANVNATLAVYAELRRLNETLERLVADPSLLKTLDRFAKTLGDHPPS